MRDRVAGLTTAEQRVATDRQEAVQQIARLAPLQAALTNAEEVAQGFSREAARLSAENGQLQAELAHERQCSEFLRSLNADDEPDGEPRRDTRVSVDGEEFISRRLTQTGATFYVYARDPETGKRRHVEADDLEEARALRDELHPAMTTPDKVAP